MKIISKHIGFYVNKYMTIWFIDLYTFCQRHSLETWLVKLGSKLRLNCRVITWSDIYELQVSLYALTLMYLVLSQSKETKRHLILKRCKEKLVAYYVIFSYHSSQNSNPSRQWYHGKDSGSLWWILKNMYS